ncbi:hypothetical protein HCUR_00705 [Holospora curviuscula]|uniref:Uncharacterized protein n=1 Tax=Holospora curviuscula TaxID=1082868 RepID=A0A2S5R9W4_9PROT|nr:hypothetical protein HCUR_00705 [Holospora curviuscula]
MYAILCTTRDSHINHFSNLLRIILVKASEINALADSVDLSYSLDSLLKCFNQANERSTPCLHCFIILSKDPYV